MASEKLVLKISEVAEVLGCSKSKAYLMAAAGEIPIVEIGGLKRVPRAALEKLLEEKLAACRGGDDAR